MVYLRTELKVRSGMVGLLPIIIMVILTIIVFPTPRQGIIEETRWVQENVTSTYLVKELSCDIKISNGGDKTWNLNDLGKNLTIAIDITSEEIVDIQVEGVQGKCYSNKGKIILDQIAVDGPSLVISIHNPLDITLQRATLNGEISIYETVTELKDIKIIEKVNGTILRPWWMQ